MSNNKERGIIAKKFTIDHYGFIHQVMFKHDIFFKSKDFKEKDDFKQCRIGDGVSFELDKTPKGYVARNIKLCQKI